MSGGHFDYVQYRFVETEDALREIVKDEDGDYDLPGDIASDVKEALDCLTKARLLINRIDYLVSGDDGEESYRRRVKEDFESEGIQKNVPVEKGQ